MCLLLDIESLSLSGSYRSIVQKYPCEINIGDQTSQKTGTENSSVFIEKSALHLPPSTLAAAFLCMKCASSQWGENMLDALLGNFVSFLEMLCGSLPKDKLSC